MVLEESPPHRAMRRPRSRTPRTRRSPSPKRSPSYSPPPRRRRRSRSPPMRARDDSSFDSQSFSSYSSMSRSPPPRRRRTRLSPRRRRSPASSASYSSFSSRSPPPRRRPSRSRRRSLTPPPPRRYRSRYSPPQRYRAVSPPPRRRRHAPRNDRRDERPADTRRDKPLRRDDRARDLRTVFVSQLAQRVHQDDLYDFFSRAGRVRDVRLVMDRMSSRHKGAGYVEFYEEESVPLAVAFDSTSLRGFPVAVKATVDMAGRLQGRKVQTASKEMQGKPVDIPAQAANPLKAHDDSVVGWSNKYRARKPDADAFSAGAVPRAHAGARVPQSSQVPQLVSIEELKRLLNPLCLPIAPPPLTAMGVGVNVGAAGQPLEQVPLPTAGSAKIAPQPSASSGAFTRLYVGSISFQLTEADLRAIFEPFGAISSLQLQRDATGSSRGYGFVEFLTHESAKKALEINGLAVAGRTLKVALASQEHRMAVSSTAADRNLMGSVPLPGPGGAALDVPGELDEGKDSGLAINASQRIALMQQLSRGESIGKTGTNAGKLPVCAEPSKNVMLANLFDPATEQEGFELDLKEDVRDECISKYGAVAHLVVEPKSQGVVFVRFQARSDAEKARTALNGRWFGGRRIQASFVGDKDYMEKFPSATNE